MTHKYALLWVPTMTLLDLERVAVWSTQYTGDEETITVRSRYVACKWIGMDYMVFETVVSGRGEEDA